MQRNILERIILIYNAIVQKLCSTIFSFYLIYIFSLNFPHFHLSIRIHNVTHILLICKLYVLYSNKCSHTLLYILKNIYTFSHITCNCIKYICIYRDHLMCLISDFRFSSHILYMFSIF